MKQSTNRSTYTWNKKIENMARKLGDDIRLNEKAGTVFEE